jgi:peptidoglycan-N-acetylglucosamine deacetylase
VFYFKKDPLVVRRLENLKKSEVFLTFDDGPDFTQTTEVLDLLAEAQWTASFFVIGKKAAEQKNLIRRMLQEGHGVMSHSEDHDYSHFFKSKSHLKTWIQNSLVHLSEITLLPQTVFRPPAGILTPPLIETARDLGVPLVLWNQRYFDSLWALKKGSVKKNVSQINPGDIVLFHDVQRPRNQKNFIQVLNLYIQQLKALGFTGKALTNQLILDQAQASSRI